MSCPGGRTSAGVPFDEGTAEFWRLSGEADLCGCGCGCSASAGGATRGDTAMVSVCCRRETAGRRAGGGREGGGGGLRNAIGNLLVHSRVSPQPCSLEAGYDRTASSNATGKHRRDSGLIRCSGPSGGKVDGFVVRVRLKTDQRQGLKEDCTNRRDAPLSSNKRSGAPPI